MVSSNIIISIMMGCKCLFSHFYLIVSLLQVSTLHCHSPQSTAGQGVNSKSGHARVYRRLLREEVTSGRLDAAPSKAAVLQQLCERLKFNPEAASALHKSLYRQKIDQILEEKKKIAGVPA